MEKAEIHRYRAQMQGQPADGIISAYHQQDCPEQLKGQRGGGEHQAQPSPISRARAPVEKAEQQRAQRRRGQIYAMDSGKQAEALRFRAY